MARPLRIEVPGGVFHVMARGNERRPIFQDDADRQRYLDRLAHYREKFEFELIAYCLLDNHVHLAVRTGRFPLSRIMAGLQTSYTQAFNGRHRRVGHLFQGRYKALLVEEDLYLLGLVRYIHRNPVEAGVVQRPGDYRWSSDRFYRKGRGPKWLDLDRVLAMLGARRPAATRAYRALMGDEVDRPYEEARSIGQLVVGEKDFARRVLVAGHQTSVVRRSLTEAQVARRVAAHAGFALTDLRAPGRGHRASRARALAAHLAKTVGGISIARMARYFRRDASTLFRGFDRIEEDLKSSAALRAEVSRLTRSLGRG
ncbi:MAG TPA: transposase [Thermoanaerobaculia bacterium]|nr:transposase [Thermoanaerobaculia bacterium]